MVGNLNDLKESEELLPIEKLLPIDKFILSKLNSLIESVIESYDDMNLNKSLYLIENFMLTSLSSFYIKAVKDRLYCEKINSFERRSAQTALYHILTSTALMISPIMPHLAEEAFCYSVLKKQLDSNNTGITLFRSDLKLIPNKSWSNKEVEIFFDSIVVKIREFFYEKVQTNNSATLEVILKCDKNLFNLLNSYNDANKWLEECFGSADLKIELLDKNASKSDLLSIKNEQNSVLYNYQVILKKTENFNCPRCRRFKSLQENTLCKRCAELIV
jgi:isoleucyl-tRNA synthetase